MSSQIHAQLCSPVSTTASPTHRRGQSASLQQSSSATSSIRSYLIPDRPPRSPDLEGQGLKARSPHSTSAQFEATLTVPDYSHYPSAYSRSSSSAPPARSGRSLPTSPKGRRESAPPTPKNVVSRPVADGGFTIPKPILRMACLLMALAAFALLLARAPALHIPLLRHVNVRRGAGPMAQEGYQPPQTHAAGMLNRAHAAKSTRTPSFAPHPIPPSHELLALQSYLLQSEHNTLPADMDPSKPLDGNAILAISPTKLGRPGSPAELLWLKELDREREEDIIIWANGNPTEVEGMYELLGKLHLNDKSPTHIDLAGRSDAEVLGSILKRLGADVRKPMVMMGNRPVYGGLAKLKKMYEDESLDIELKRIGWYDGWKAQQARETKEVEAGTEEAGNRDARAEAGAGKPRVMNAGFKHE